MSRYQCQRCGATCFTTDNPPHLCRDLRKRLERQTQAVRIVEAILANYGLHQIEARQQIALDIIKALAGRDLGV